jgi:hypothetical protein
MRKADPDKVKQSFQQKLNELEQFLERVSKQIEGTSNEKADLSQLAESVFLSACVAYENMVSDLFLAYINRDPSKLQKQNETRIRQSIKQKFGDWENRVQFTSYKHIPYSEIQGLIDPNNRNLTFKNAAEMKTKSNELLSRAYSKKINSCSQHDEQLIDTAKAIRNYIAHRSTGARDYMNQCLLKIDTKTVNAGLGREQNKVDSAGSFLKTNINGKRRVRLYINRFRDIAGKM